jgi:hypothetical protein
MLRLTVLLAPLLPLPLLLQRTTTVDPPSFQHTELLLLLLQDQPSLSQQQQGLIQGEIPACRCAE